MDFNPDLWVYPPELLSSTRYSEYNPSNWDSDNAFMVEVEAFPRGSPAGEWSKGTGSHLDRTVEHFENGTERYGVPMVFIVKNDEDAKAVESRLKEAGGKIVSTVRGGEEKGCVQVKVMDPKAPADGNLAEQIRESVKELERGEEEIMVFGEEEEEPEEEEELGEEEEEKDWRTKLEDSVGEFKELRKEGAPTRELARVLVDLKDQGCSFRTTTSRGKDYVTARKSAENDRVEKGLGRLDGEIRNALDLAGIQV